VRRAARVILAPHVLSGSIPAPRVQTQLTKEDGSKQEDELVAKVTAVANRLSKMESQRATLETKVHSRGDVPCRSSPRRTDTDYV